MNTPHKEKQTEQQALYMPGTNSALLRQTQTATYYSQAAGSLVDISLLT